jgi:carboxylesterase
MRWFAIIAAALVLLVALGSLLPTGTRGLGPRPDPARSYEQAIISFARQQSADDSVVAQGGGSILLAHGHRTPRAVVLLHGYTNSPSQFEEFAHRLYDAGDNVYVPRLPRHGERNGTASTFGRLTAEELRDCADSAVDVAEGLGYSVVTVGLSAGGTMVAWIAQHRAVRRAVVIAPVLELSRVPTVLAEPLMNLALRAPNITWNETPDVTEPDRELGVSTRAIAQLLRLGWAVRQAAKDHPPRTRDIAVLTNAHDRTVSSRRAIELARFWSRPGVSVDVYELPDSLKLRHDIIDPRQRWAKPAVVYPILEALVRGEPPTAVPTVRQLLHHR